MKRYFRHFPFSMFFVSILCMGLGLAVLLWPGAAVKVLCYGLGAVLILAALFQVGAFLAREQDGLLRNLMLLSAFISAVLGVWVLLSPEKVQTLAMIVMGVVLLYHGGMDIKYAFDVRSCQGKSWSAVLLCGLATCGVGVLMLVDPFEKIDTLFFTAGLGFLFDGATDLFTVFSLAGSRVRAERLEGAAPVVEISSTAAEALPAEEPAADPPTITVVAAPPAEGPKK